MIKVMFVCHGNICRSPMAEFVFKDMVKKEGLEKEFLISSSATSTEEIGNGVHFGTRKKLAEFNISTKGKYAVRLTKKDYFDYDYIIGMDDQNIRNIFYILGEDKQNKVSKLLDFENGGNIADPWYTGNFDETYNDILKGCKAFLEFLKRNQLK